MLWKFTLRGGAVDGSIGKEFSDGASSLHVLLVGYWFGEVV